MKLLGCMVVAMVAGCGDGDPSDASGVYTVDSDVGSRCGTDVPESPGSAYVNLRAEGAGYTFSLCQDAAATVCGPENGLATSTATGWTGTAASGQVGGEVPTCALIYTVWNATVDGPHLTLDTTVYVQAEPVGTVTCTSAEASQRGTSMPCYWHQRIVATLP